MQQQPRTTYTPRKKSEVESTPSLLNEVYSRLRVSAAAYKKACGVDELGAIHTWMNSYADRLNGMADQLQDEGARSRKEFAGSADDLEDERNCGEPTSLLKAAEVNQKFLIDSYQEITERLDMDAELYGYISDQYDELSEVLEDMQDLRREYEVYGEQATL